MFTLTLPIQPISMWLIDGHDGNKSMGVGKYCHSHIRKFIVIINSLKKSLNKEISIGFLGYHDGNHGTMGWEICHIVHNHIN